MNISVWGGFVKWSRFGVNVMGLCAGTPSVSTNDFDIFSPNGWEKSGVKLFT